MSGATPVNDQLVSWMAAFFQRHGNPVTPYQASVGSNPPSDAHLDAAFDTPVNLPQPFLAVIRDGGANIRFVVAYSGSWYYTAALTLAV